MYHTNNNYYNDNNNILARRVLCNPALVLLCAWPIFKACPSQHVPVNKLYAMQFLKLHICHWTEFTQESKIHVLKPKGWMIFK